MRVRFISLALAVVFFVPVAASAGIPYFGPIIPTAYNTCAAGWSMLIVVVNNIISFLLTIAILFVLPLMVAWAGFLYVINPVNPNKRTEANTMLLHAIVGIAIALASWLLVNALMVALVNPNASSGGTRLGAWYDIVSGRLGEVCLKQAGALNPSRGPGISAGGTLSRPPQDKTGTACDPAKVQQAAAAAGSPINSTEANVFACIAEFESSCQNSPNPPNYRWDKGTAGNPGSTAAGAFQVLLQSNARCYQTPACTRAANVSQLDCANAFTNGNPKKDSSGNVIPAAQACLRAASDFECSTAAAVCLLRQNNNSFSPWQADRNSSRQTACINRGGV